MIDTRQHNQILLMLRLVPTSAPTLFRPVACLSAVFLSLAAIGCTDPAADDDSTTSLPTGDDDTTTSPSTGDDDTTTSPPTGDDDTDVSVKTPSPPQISVSPDSLAFDSVVLDATSDATLEVSNLGSTTLTVTVSLTGGDGSFQLVDDSWEGLRLIDGEDNADLVVRFSPLEPGNYTGSLVLYSNDPHQPSITVPLTGAGLDDSADTDQDGYTARDDCDDNNPDIHPGTEETCDETDQDCDGAIDEGLPLTRYYADEDGDGFGDFQSRLEACSEPVGYLPEPAEGIFDCDDQVDTTYPGALEACDGNDNDCDTLVDEDGATWFYLDQDGDGFGDLTHPELTCEPDEDLVSNADDCNDSDPAIYPGAAELCDGLDQNCDQTADDGALVVFYADMDQDGAGNPLEMAEACSAPAGYVAEANDCDDGDASSHPGGTEVCDHLDNDCDGTPDEGVTTTFYADRDGDTFGDAATTTQDCEPPDGYVTNATDCNDRNVNVHPDAEELCNLEDDDCDSATDEGLTQIFYRDEDGDGFGDANKTIEACSVPDGYAVMALDCNDKDAAIHPGTRETCNGKDDNCDGTLDEGTKKAYYPDADKDGQGSASNAVQACSAPAGYVTNNTDCNDQDPAIYKGAPEVCNGKDDDCDSLVDDGVKSTFYPDTDGDGQGGQTGSVQACQAPGGYVANSTDCDDANSAVYLGADEVCNDKDDDCDTRIDDGVKINWYQDLDQDGYGTDADIIVSCDAQDGYAGVSGDCDDSSPSAHPGAYEVCGDPDLNCDGEWAVCSTCLEIKEAGYSTGDGIYWIDLDGDGAVSPQPVYCDMSTEGGGWTMVYKISQNIAGDAYQLWIGKAQNEKDESILNLEASSKHYVSRIISEYWNKNDLALNEARVSLYTGGAEVATLKFSAAGSDWKNWFAQSRLTASPWTDILTVSKNYFSIEGDAANVRRFFIHYYYGGCANDLGWLVVVARPTTGCAWEGTNRMRILYSNQSTYSNWDQVVAAGTAGMAEVLAVFVR